MMTPEANDVQRALADAQKRNRRARVAVAAGDLYVAIRRGALSGKETTWAAKLGPLNRQERDRARRFVSDLIVAEVSAPGRSPAERALAEAWGIP